MPESQGSSSSPPPHKQQMDKAGELTEASLSLGSIIADYDKW